MARYSKKHLAEIILAQASAQKRSEAIKAVAGYLVSASRSRELEGLIREIELVAQERYHHTVSKVTSRYPISGSQLAEIKQLLKSYSGSTEVEIEQSIDASLIGGIVINTPDSEADLSVAGRLKRLSN